MSKSEAETPPEDAPKDPTVPSEANLKARAEETATKAKKPRKTRESADDKASREQQEEHFKFSAFMAQQSTESLDMVLSQADRLYDRSLKYVEQHNQLKLTFTFTDQEKNTVNQSFFELYKRSNPEFMEKWGVLVTAMALVATVAIPRIMLASKLNGIEKALDSEAAGDDKTEPAQEPVGVASPK